MSDRIFIDTNILVYAFLENDIEKHKQTTNLLTELIGKEVFISIQVMSEVYSALSKNGVAHEKIEKYLFELEEDMNVQPLDFYSVKRCLTLKKKYNYSYWDSLILASSIEADCEILYSEDMQNGQLIDNKLRILNPFIVGGGSMS
jgi:predicted nucleic acid-binding protein